MQWALPRTLQFADCAGTGAQGSGGAGVGGAWPAPPDPCALVSVRYGLTDASAERPLHRLALTARSLLSRATSVPDAPSPAPFDVGSRTGPATQAPPTLPPSRPEGASER